MVATGRGSPPQYEFRISGRLDRRWESWFGGLTVAHEDDTTTTLRGSVIDQAALHGVLARFRDLGVILISIRALDDASDGPPAARPELPQDLEDGTT